MALWDRNRLAGGKRIIVIVHVVIVDDDLVVAEATSRRSDDCRHRILNRCRCILVVNGHDLIITAITGTD